MDKSSLVLSEIDSPLGKLTVGVFEDAVCLLNFSDGDKLEQQLEKLCKELNADQEIGDHILIDQVEQQLNEYFEGARKVFEVPLLFTGTNFQKQVWTALLSISFADTKSYKQQAAAVGNVNAVRAVAKANGDNRIVIIVPCHRIIGSDGSIVGYSGGLKNKQWLLQHEFENQ